MRHALWILLLLMACRSRSSDPATDPAATDLLESLCPPQARSALPVLWNELPIPLPGGTLCANEEDFPEWKDGIEILHRGGVDDMASISEAYIAMFVAAGWTKVTREKRMLAKGQPILHVHVMRADDTQAVSVTITSNLDRVRVGMERIGWEDQRRNTQLEIDRRVEEAMARNHKDP